MNPNQRKKLLSAGVVSLCLWALPTIVLGFAFTIGLVFFDTVPPILRITLTPPQLQSLDPAVLSSIKDLAILFNSSSAALGILVVLVSTKNLRNGQRWAYLAIFLVVGFVQIVSFAGDAKIGNATLPINISLTILYLAGVLLSGISIYKR